jgi:hypothetical protein
VPFSRCSVGRLPQLLPPVHDTDVRCQAPQLHQKLWQAVVVMCKDFCCARCWTVIDTWLCAEQLRHEQRTCADGTTVFILCDTCRRVFAASTGRPLC